MGAEWMEEVEKARKKAEKLGKLTYIALMLSVNKKTYCRHYALLTLIWWLFTWYIAKRTLDYDQKEEKKDALGNTIVEGIGAVFYGLHDNYDSISDTI